jgi:hypothetical protein
LKRLLVFGERVWEELLGVAGREEKRARAGARATAPPSPVPAVLHDDVEQNEPEPALCLAVELEVSEWWELEHWNEIPDESSIWGDPDPETARIAAELLLNNRMDT